MYRLSRLEKIRRDILRGRETPENGDPALQDIYRRYAAWLDESRAAAEEKLDDIKTHIAYEKFLLSEARKKSRAHSVNGERRSTPQTRLHAGRIEMLEDELSGLVRNDPDAFFVNSRSQLLHDMEDEHTGRLVDVPYLKRARHQIRTSLDAGIPVYLVGHLGSGKTQLAVECAQDYMRENLLQKKLSEKMDGWRKDHPDAGDGEELRYFEKIYKNIREEISKEDCHPYFIAGSHNLTAEDMFFEKTLRLSHATGSASDSEQLNSLISGFTSFLKDNEERLNGMKSDQQMELMLAGWKTFSQLYIAENTGYGTTVEKIEKEVLKAVREGRPIVIDEINTIAMANLIGLNDILQHHAGQTAYITGVGNITIADGFCLIGTGNLSTGTVTYEGTNVLNPAFQSRFTTIVYNYVPQETDGTLDEQLRSGRHPEHNELFRLIIDHLCAEDGTLSVPQPAETLPSLWRLSQLARVSQNIFEGHGSLPDSKGDTPVLNEAVLSIRNLIHVMDHWNLGEEEDLSMALWNGFLSSVTNADDRNLLLALFVRYGFFKEEDGWHIENRARGDAALSFDDIRTASYRHHIMPLETLPAEDVVCLLYGNGPKRKELPESLRKDIMIDDDPAAALGQAQKTDEELRHLEHSALVLGQEVQATHAGPVVV